MPSVVIQSFAIKNRYDFREQWHIQTHTHTYVHVYLYEHIYSMTFFVLPATDACASESAMESVY